MKDTNYFTDEIEFEENLSAPDDCDHESEHCPHNSDEWTDEEWDRGIYG